MNILKKINFWLVAVIAVVFTAFIAYYLGFATGIAVLAIFVSTFFASWSLRIANKSLETTKQTQRPFLTIADDTILPETREEEELTVKKMSVTVENTGNYPADQVNVICTVNKQSDNNSVTQNLIVNERNPIPSILFPNQNLHITFESDNTPLTIIKGESGWIEVKATYLNKLTNIEHTTKRIWKNNHPGFHFNNFIADIGSDYWK